MRASLSMKLEDISLLNRIIIQFHFVISVSLLYYDLLICGVHSESWVYGCFPIAGTFVDSVVLRDLQDKKGRGGVDRLNEKCLEKGEGKGLDFGFLWFEKQFFKWMNFQKEEKKATTSKIQSLSWHRNTNLTRFVSPEACDTDRIDHASNKELSLQTNARYYSGWCRHCWLGNLLCRKFVSEEVADCWVMSLMTEICELCVCVCNHWTPALAVNNAAEKCAWKALLQKAFCGKSSSDADIFIVCLGSGWLI